MKLKISETCTIETDFFYRLADIERLTDERSWIRFEVRILNYILEVPVWVLNIV
jgi:hypothetical protein